MPPKEPHNPSNVLPWLASAWGWGWVVQLIYAARGFDPMRELIAIIKGRKHEVQFKTERNQPQKPLPPIIGEEGIVLPFTPLDKHGMVVKNTSRKS